ncbi:MAG: DUF1453 domain-containing protein [Bacillus sp. (in: Bacteria)]|nr:DUF1453 domain-containing protein [Bacillus safensis]MBR0636606.1 DUF1453 domain-containing protein [Bacillus safensis]MBR3208292.1 DUF1453 domain-containing protein [Bacillus sp. (in: firmicutes)]
MQVDAAKIEDAYDEDRLKRKGDLVMTIQIVIIMIILLLRTGKEKEIRPIRLLIGPLILLGTLSYSFTQHIEITAMSLLAMIVFALAGFAIGLWRGKLYKVTYDQQSGRITAASSLYGTLFFIGIILIRMTVGSIVQDGGHSLIIFANGLTFLPIGSMIGLRFILLKRYMNIKASAAI